MTHKYAIIIVQIIIISADTALISARICLSFKALYQVFPTSPFDAYYYQPLFWHHLVFHFFLSTIFFMQTKLFSQKISYKKIQKSFSEIPPSFTRVIHQWYKYFYPFFFHFSLKKLKIVETQYNKFRPDNAFTLPGLYIKRKNNGCLF